MQEIKCPKCGSVFQVNESDYAQIASQVRNAEFDRELARRQAEWDAVQRGREETAELRQRQALDGLRAEKDAELVERAHQLDGLRAQLAASETKSRLDTSEALRLAQESAEKELQKVRDRLADTERAYDRLREQLAGSQTAQKLAVTEAVREKELALAERDQRIVALEGQLQSQSAEAKVQEKALEDRYAEKLREKDTQIAFYRDLKARQSTKMVGETLEQHCLTKFNEIRASAFPNAFFEKDNDARSGSKGDFIFREQQDGIEFLSIMFEMKNETDSTSTKHKNEDFLKELDKDRQEKKCEYAILVSLLEPDNELYNNGIVDVSYRYPKMYVIRPQFFLPVISMLRNAALNGLGYRRELQEVQNRQLDVQNFEQNIRDFQEGFANNYRIASNKFRDAIDEIDKTIDHLNKIRDALTSSERQLRLANDKADSLSIKKLTKNAPSVRALFEGTAEDAAK